MRYGRHISDASHGNPGGLQRPNSGLSTSPRPPDVHLHLAQSKLHTLLGGVFGRPLCSVGRSLTRSLEARRSSASPGKHITLVVCKGYYGVVEGRLYICPSLGDELLLTFSAPWPPWHSSPLQPLSPYFRRSLLQTLRLFSVDRKRDYFLETECLRPATVLRAPRLVRALVRVRCPLTGSRLWCRRPR